MIRYMAIGLLAQILLCALVPRAEAQDKTAAKAKTMNTQELVELSRLEFNLIDADKNGHISQKELDSRAKSLFNSLDKDKDGSLSKTEFLDIPPQVAIKLLPQDVKPKRSRKELAEDAFKALDSDGDGKISRADFEAAFVSEFKEIDRDANGKITVQEFIVLKVPCKERDSSKQP